MSEPRSVLEIEVHELRERLTALEERARLDAVAQMFLADEHPIREGDYFILEGHYPSRLNSIDPSNGRWTYHDTNGRQIEAFRVPEPVERLYTVAEVAEIVARMRRQA